jgi:hypothetical protein
VPSEKDLDRALHEALETNARFREWFVAQLRFGRGYTKLVLCRSNHPWGKVRLILPNKQTGALEPVDREGETDVLAVFEHPSGDRLGVHVENKLSSGVFTLYQPEVCAARAERWIGLKEYGAYHRWETVLLAPNAFIDRNGTESRKFISCVPHESVAAHLSVFRVASAG